MDSHARPVTCIFAIQRHARDDGANARNKKAALPRPFELIALNWEWSYGDSNPKTSCLPRGDVTTMADLGGAGCRGCARARAPRPRRARA